MIIAMKKYCYVKLRGARGVMVIVVGILDENDCISQLWIQTC